MYKQEININKSLFDFMEMAKKINTYLNEDKISLTFEGYKDTLLDYISFSDNSLGEDLFNLITDCVLWFNYFCELQGLIELKFLECELDLDIALANNLNNTDFKKIKVKHYHYKTFLKQIKFQQKIFSKCIYHCSLEYGEGINTLTFKSY